MASGEDTQLLALYSILSKKKILKRWQCYFLIKQNSSKTPSGKEIWKTGKTEHTSNCHPQIWALEEHLRKIVPKLNQLQTLEGTCSLWGLSNGPMERKLDREEIM